jgi:hypothetical protein
VEQDVDAAEPGISQDSGVAASTAAPYMRSRPVEAAAGAATFRASRGLITDYGYVVDELKRIGLTFGGLIVLLIVISRFLK